MRRLLFNLISVTLIIVTALLSLTSCAWFRKLNGYTGGFGSGGPMDNSEYRWVETYEEAQEAIELLESHDSTLYKSAIFSYEGDLFDTKYCFVFMGARDPMKNHGDNPFDRWAELVEVRVYGFFDDVSIDEIEYSYVHNYDVVYLNETTEFFRTHESDSDFNIDLVTLSWTDEHSNTLVIMDQLPYFEIYREKDSGYVELSEECVQVILESIVFIGDFHYFNY